MVCLDKHSTGQPDNVAHLAGRPGFELAECDVSAGIEVGGPVGAVAHLASEAYADGLSAASAGDARGGEPGLPRDGLERDEA